MTVTYVLNSDHTVEQMDDLVEWTKRREIDDNMVAHDVIAVGDKSVEITTAFTGIAHEPGTLLFETAIFGYRAINDVVESYATYADAQRGHDCWVGTVRRSYSSEASPSESPPESSPRPSSGSDGEAA